MLATERQHAIAIALEAGTVLMEVYGQEDFQVDLKAGGSPVTEADRRANDLIVEGLRQHFPDDGIVAEEFAQQDDLGRKGRVWYVDPLDGTKEFLARNGEFSTMIGLTIDGAAVLGVVYRPVGDKLYHGVIGAGAALRTGGVETPLQVSDKSAPPSLAMVASRSHRAASVDAIAERLGIKEIASSGSVGLKVGLLAEQRCDLYAHVSSKSSAWDACAPEAILRAAGGRFTDCAGRPFVYGQSKDLQNRGGILACNAAAYDAVLPVVRSVATEFELIA